ncbi:MAG: hypothetical protein AAF399_04820 [Bacteroidota bacterium]
MSAMLDAADQPKPLVWWKTRRTWLIGLAATGILLPMLWWGMGQGSGFREQGTEIRVQGSGDKVQGSGGRDQGSWDKDQGAGFSDARDLTSFDKEQRTGIRVQGSEIVDQGAGGKDQGSEIRDQSSEIVDQGVGDKDQVSGIRVEGAESEEQESAIVEAPLPSLGPKVIESPSEIASAARTAKSSTSREQLSVVSENLKSGSESVGGENPSVERSALESPSAPVLTDQVAASPYQALSTQSVRPLASTEVVSPATISVAPPTLELPALQAVAELPKATFLQKSQTRLKLALGPGENLKWADAKWAAQLNLVAISSQFPLLIEQVPVRAGVGMSGIELGISRKVGPRLHLGAQLSSLELYQVVVPPVYPSGLLANYPFLSGNAVELSSFVQWHLRKDSKKRFRPFLLAGAGIHHLNYSVFEVNSQPYQALRASFVGDMNNAFESAEAPSNFPTPNLVQTYRLAVASKRSTPEASLFSNASLEPAPNTQLAIMGYGGVGIDIRLYRNLQFTYQMSLHALSYVPGEGRNELNSSSDFSPSLGDPTEPTTVSNLDYSIPGNWQAGQYPNYFRTSFGLKWNF